jgi:hypothetical protein
VPYLQGFKGFYGGREERVWETTRLGFEPRQREPKAFGLKKTGSYNQLPFNNLGLLSDSLFFLGYL